MWRNLSKFVLIRFKSFAMPRNGWRCADDHFRSVVLAKILFASPAWWGFANSSDKQRLEAFMRRCVRLSFYRQDDSTVDQLVVDLGDGLIVCCCFIKRSARSSLYFTWTQYSFVQS